MTYKKFKRTMKRIHPIFYEYLSDLKINTNIDVIHNFYLDPAFEKFTYETNKNVLRIMTLELVRENHDIIAFNLL